MSASQANEKSGYFPRYFPPHFYVLPASKRADVSGQASRDLSPTYTMYIIYALYGQHQK